MSDGSDGERTKQISVKSAAAGKIKRFHLLCHDDIYKSKILGIWQMEIYSLSTVDVLTQMGYLTQKKLVVYSDQ